LTGLKSAPVLIHFLPWEALVNWPLKKILIIKMEVRREKMFSGENDDRYRQF
jgi:hypothetical protein